MKSSAPVKNSVDGLMDAELLIRTVLSRHRTQRTASHFSSRSIPSNHPYAPLAFTSPHLTPHHTSSSMPDLAQSRSPAAGCGRT